MWHHLLIGLGVMAYLGCAILAYGITFHSFETSFPGLAHESGNAGFAVGMAILGPVGLFVALIMGGPHGLEWRHNCERSIARHRAHGKTYCPTCISSSPITPWEGRP